MTSSDDLTGEVIWYWYDSDRLLDIPIDRAIWHQNVYHDIFNSQTNLTQITQLYL